MCSRGGGLTPGQDAAGLQICVRRVGGTTSFSKRVAVIRCEVRTGDVRMCSAFHLAGCEPWDVAVADLASGSLDLDRFRGVAFVGGFSFHGYSSGFSKRMGGSIKYHATCDLYLSASKPGKTL